MSHQLQAESSVEVDAQYDVTMIGAGPVGCLMSCFLRKLGLTVVIYEKREDPRVKADSGKSINLALSMRGLTALGSLDEGGLGIKCLKEAVRMMGRRIWTKGEGLYQPYSLNPSEYLWSINRANLNNDLISLAQSRGVTIIFKHAVDSILFDQKKVVLKNLLNNRRVDRSFKTLWGVDGSNSKVRSEIERMCGITEANCGVQRFRASYKEFEIPPTADGKAQLQPVEAFHVWPRDGPNFFIALPNADNSFTCTMFTNNDDPLFLGNLDDNHIVKLFKEEFPDVAKIMGDAKIKADHRANPVSGLYTVDVAKWHWKGDAVIMGDAAHGIVPYYGLGINGGFEGCRHMYNIIKKHSHLDKNSGGYVFHWERIFSEFNKFKEHSDVLRIMSIRNADELGVKVKDPRFLFGKEVERELQRRYPNSFIETHSLLSFTNVPLVACYQHILKQERIITEVVDAAHPRQNDWFDIKKIDWSLADKLVKKLLIDLNKVKFWYEEGGNTSASL